MTEYDKVIPPGGVGKVTAQIHTTSFKGPIAKSVTVTTSDPDNKTFTLNLKANVLVPLDVQPSETVSFLGRYDALQPQVLTITSTDGKPFDITSVTSRDAAYKAKIEGGKAPKAGTVGSGSSKYTMTVSPPPNPQVGRLNTQIDVKTTHPKAADLTIRVYGTITGDITHAPQTAMLQVGPSATPDQKVAKVLVQKSTGDPLKITGITSENPSIKATHATLLEGREYEVTITFTGEPLPQALSAMVRVATNDKRQPVVEIPIFGRADPPTSTGGAMSIAAPGAKVDPHAGHSHP